MDGLESIADKGNMSLPPYMGQGMYDPTTGRSITGKVIDEPSYNRRQVYEEPRDREREYSINDPKEGLEMKLPSAGNYIPLLAIRDVRDTVNMIRGGYSIDDRFRAGIDDDHGSHINYETILHNDNTGRDAVLDNTHIKMPTGTFGALPIPELHVSSIRIDESKLKKWDKPLTKFEF